MYRLNPYTLKLRYYLLGTHPHYSNYSVEPACCIYILVSLSKNTTIKNRKRIQTIMANRAPQVPQQSANFPQGGNRNMVVTLLMKGKQPGLGYLPGVLTLGYSLLLHRTNPNDYSIGIMIDEATSKEVETMAALGDIYGPNIFTVPYIEAKVRPLVTARQQELYAPWIERSFTKWNCLLMSNYEKVLFLDADTLVLRDIGGVFEKKTPSADFKLYFSSSRSWGGIYYPYARGMKDGDVVDIGPDFTRLSQGLSVGHVMGAGVVLLSPDRKVYEQVLKELSEAPPEGYGYGGISAPDEQALVRAYMRLNQVWYNLDSEYQVVPRFAYAYQEITRPKILHFIGGKPWDTANYNKGYADIDLWWSYVDKIILDTLLGSNIKKYMSGIASPVRNPYCAWCKLIGRASEFYYSHTLLACPVLSGQTTVKNEAAVPNLQSILHQTVPNITLPLPKTHYLYFDVLRTLPYNIYVTLLNRMFELLTLDQVKQSATPSQGLGGRISAPNVKVPNASIYVRSAEAGAGLVAARNHFNVSRVSSNPSFQSETLTRALQSPVKFQLESGIDEKLVNFAIFNNYTADDILSIIVPIQGFLRKNIDVAAIALREKQVDFVKSLLDSDFAFITENVALANSQISVLYVINKSRSVSNVQSKRLLKLLPQAPLYTAPIRTESKRPPTGTGTATLEEKETPLADDPEVPRGQLLGQVDTKVSSVKIYKYKQIDDATKREYQQKLTKYLRWLLGASDYFKAEQKTVNALVNANTIATWIRAFTASSYDPDDNYERSETLGDKVTGQYLVYRAFNVNKNYTSAEITRIVSNYNVNLY